MSRDTKGRFIRGEKAPKHFKECQCFRCTKKAWNKGKEWDKEIKEKIRLSHLGKKYPQTQGKNNWHWKGDKVGYIGLHSWINKSKGKPLFCINCGSKENLVWSNISYKYNRDLEDWESLCQKCHIRKDAKNGWGIALRKFPDLKRYYDKRKYEKNICRPVITKDAS